MIRDWFTCKVKYHQIDDNGKEVKTMGIFLVDGLSYSDAETRIYTEMENTIRGAFKIINLTKSNYTEIINGEDTYQWYKIKLSCITFDEETGKEKKSNYYYLVSASSCKEAIDNLENNIKNRISDYVISTVSVTNIIDVFPYLEGEHINTETAEVLN